MEKKNLLETIAGILSSNIPGKGISNFLFQKIQHIKGQKDVEEFSLELKERIKEINSLSQWELVNLGTGLYAAFQSQREYKQGWVVDAYWEVYDRCNELNRTVLSSVSGW